MWSLADITGQLVKDTLPCKANGEQTRNPLKTHMHAHTHTLTYTHTHTKKRKKKYKDEKED